MSLFSSKSSDSQNMERRQVFWSLVKWWIDKKPEDFNAVWVRFSWKNGSTKQKTMTTKQNQTNKANHTRQNERTAKRKKQHFQCEKQQDVGQRLGEKAAHVLDTKNLWSGQKKRSKAAKYRLSYLNSFMKEENVTLNVTDFKQSMANAKLNANNSVWTSRSENENIAQKALELDKARKRRKENPSSPVQNNQQRHV